VVGRPAAEWLAPDIARVIAMMAAVVDGMAALDETFPPLKDDEQLDERALLDTFAQSAPGSPEAPAAPGADAGAVGVPSPTAPAPSRQEAIDKVLRAASDAAVSQPDRLANLDGLQPLWQERLSDDADFVQRLFKLAGQVARIEIKVADARRLLEA
jgi:hypothetical protein